MVHMLLHWVIQNFYPKFLKGHVEFFPISRASSSGRLSHTSGQSPSRDLYRDQAAKHCATSQSVRLPVGNQRAKSGIHGQNLRQFSSLEPIGFAWWNLIRLF